MYARRGSLATPRADPEQSRGRLIFISGRKTMAVARSDEGSSNVARKRPARKPTDPQTPLPSAVRLDDLYRLPMPRLFAVAEREGIAEHTGMSRGQLIMTMVRHQIERGA